jgi:hypothetical protein
MSVMVGAHSAGFQPPFENRIEPPTPGCEGHVVFKRGCGPPDTFWRGDTMDWHLMQTRPLRITHCKGKRAICQNSARPWAPWRGASISHGRALRRRPQCSAFVKWFGAAVADGRPPGSPINPILHRAPSPKFRIQVIAVRIPVSAQQRSPAKWRMERLSPFSAIAKSDLHKGCT